MFNGLRFMIISRTLAKLIALKHEGRHRQTLLVNDKVGLIYYLRQQTTKLVHCLNCDRFLNDITASILPLYFLFLSHLAEK